MLDGAKRYRFGLWQQELVRGRRLRRQANDERSGPANYVLDGNAAAVGLGDQTAEVKTQAPAEHAKGLGLALLEFGEDPFPIGDWDGLTRVVDRQDDLAATPCRHQQDASSGGGIAEGIGHQVVE